MTEYTDIALSDLVYIKTGNQWTHAEANALCACRFPCFSELYFGVNLVPLPMVMVSMMYGLRPLLKSGRMLSTPLAFTWRQQRMYSSCSSAGLEYNNWNNKVCHLRMSKTTENKKMEKDMKGLLFGQGSVDVHFPFFVNFYETLIWRLHTHKHIESYRLD